MESFWIIFLTIFLLPIVVITINFFYSRNLIKNGEKTDAKVVDFYHWTSKNSYVLRISYNVRGKEFLESVSIRDTTARFLLPFLAHSPNTPVIDLTNPNSFNSGLQKISENLSDIINGDYREVSPQEILENIGDVWLPIAFSSYSPKRFVVNYRELESRANK